MALLLQKAISVLYTVLTPIVNPIIYSLKNQEGKGALQRLWAKLIPGQNPLRGTGQLLTSSWISA